MRKSISIFILILISLIPFRTSPLTLKYQYQYVLHYRTVFMFYMYIIFDNDYDNSFFYLIYINFIYNLQLL